MLSLDQVRPFLTSSEAAAQGRVVDDAAISRGTMILSHWITIMALAWARPIWDSIFRGPWPDCGTSQGASTVQRAFCRCFVTLVTIDFTVQRLWRAVRMPALCDDYGRSDDRRVQAIADHWLC